MTYLISIHLGLSRVPTHRVLWYLYSSAPLDRPPKMGYRIFVQQNSSIVKLKWRHQQQTDANLDKVFRYLLGVMWFRNWNFFCIYIWLQVKTSKSQGVFQTCCIFKKDESLDTNNCSFTFIEKDRMKIKILPPFSDITL